MQVTNISGSTIRITLTKEEIKTLFGSYAKIDYQSSGSRKKLKEILLKAAEAVGAPFPTGSLYIEVMPDILGGCSIYYTQIPAENQVVPKKMRIKTSETVATAYEFSSADALIGAVALFRNSAKPEPNFHILRHGEQFLLLTEHNLLPQQKAILSEYSYASRPLNGTQAAYYAEHWKTIL